MNTPRARSADLSGDERLPNVIIIYVDDLGYGDLSCYGAAGLPTRHVDRLAAEGVRFTDAHATAATCTPSRYALLTGEYGFRSNAEILPGDAPALIPPGKFTIAEMFKRLGYQTAVIGKWHLGLGSGDVDWNTEIAPGPNQIGFDYSFIIPATNDRVPTVYLEDQRVVGLDSSDPIYVSYSERIGDRPVGYESPELLRMLADRQHMESIVNGISRIGYMQGGKDAEWIDETMHEVLVEKAVDFIHDKKDEPFFLYFPLIQPHEPRLPHQKFEGATTMGPRGDVIIEMDWMVGQVMEALQHEGLTEDTLVIFSSDNGPAVTEGYEDQAEELLGDHRPGGPLRGGKYSAFEASTRVPTIAHWPGRIAPGVSDAMTSQVDLLASLASLLGARLAGDVAIDSQDQLSAWMGESNQGREFVVKEWMHGITLRHGTLKYIEPSDVNDSEDMFAHKKIESGGSTVPQLYDLAADLGETTNLSGEMPAEVAQIEGYVATLRARTRAEPGGR